VHIIESKARLNFRVGRAKVLSWIADTGLFGSSNLSSTLFKKFQKHENLHEFL